MENENTVQLYCDIDEAGNIIRSFYGKNIIPEKSYDFFDRVDAAIVENIENYKLTLVGMKLELVLREGVGAE